MFNRKTVRPWLMGLGALLLVSCATTRIVSEDDHAKIYVDGVYKGTGKAHVRTIGPPHTADIELRREGQVVGKTEMSRSFRWQTVIWGVFSYYTGLYWAWYYPDFVSVGLDEAYAFGDEGRSRVRAYGYGQMASPNSSSQPMGSLNPWVNPRSSIWSKPLEAKAIQPKP